MRKYLIILLLLLPFWRAPAAFADDLPQPKDPAQLDYYLLTVGRGPQIEALFGHTILRVIDRGSGRDLSFNWGIFDFTDPLFAWKFYLGNLNYALAISETSALIDYYRVAERRAIIQDHLQLTTAQKAALYARLTDNALPEHIHYQYSQLRDNCSTRLRDHLDAVFGGVLGNFFKKRPASLTFRDYIKRDASPSWWIHLGLDAASNDVLDQPISAWDEMFLPSKLRELFSFLPALDDQNKPVLDHRLLENEEVLVDFPEPAPGRDPYQMISVLGGGVLLALALAITQRTPEGAAARRLGLMSLGFGLWSALWGTLFACNWWVSDYPELKHNALLWVMNPCDWLFCAYGLVCLWRRRRPTYLSWLSRAVRFLASLHLSCLLLAVVLGLCHVIKQTMLPTLASVGLLAFLYYGTMIRHAAAREP